MSKHLINLFLILVFSNIKGLSIPFHITNITYTIGILSCRYSSSFTVQFTIGKLII